MLQQPCNIEQHFLPSGAQFVRESAFASDPFPQYGGGSSSRIQVCPVLETGKRGRLSITESWRASLGRFNDALDRKPVGTVWQHELQHAQYGGSRGER